MTTCRVGSVASRLYGRLRQILRRLKRRLGRSPEYSTEVLRLFESAGTVRIVVVGANDGRLNDPIYETAMKMRDRVAIALIEPQSAVIPYLGQNYAGHPGAIVIHGAVGPAGSLVLHAIKPAYWPRVVAPYGAGWPIYRAPTGVTSTDRAAVSDWVRAYIPGVSPDEAIETQTVPCMGLEALLGANGIDWDRIDVLQIDAEGFDDVVLANSGLERFRPRVIQFENRMLSPERRAALKALLSAQGYVSSQAGPDTIALRRERVQR
jgi:hypothetical protein